MCYMHSFIVIVIWVPMPMPPILVVNLLTKCFPASPVRDNASICVFKIISWWWSLVSAATVDFKDVISDVKAGNCFSSVNSPFDVLLFCSASVMSLHLLVKSIRIFDTEKSVLVSSFSYVSNSSLRLHTKARNLWLLLISAVSKMLSWMSSCVFPLAKISSLIYLHFI